MKKNKRVVSKARVFSVIDRIQRRLNYLGNLEDSPSLHKYDRWQNVVMVSQVDRAINMLVTIGSLLDDVVYNDDSDKVEIDHKIDKVLYKYEQQETAYASELIIGVHLLCAIEAIAR